MDKVISARVDEAVANLITLLAHRLKVSKKWILEEAVRQLAATLESKDKIDPLEVSFGAWDRPEPPGETVQRARDAFNKSMGRHHS